ncbi:uncharacterized protein UTRI_04402_B [Ustilago trichophora]|uniref:Uncharacterized protein n=1 Tax=Ustilago trichophora TaxID=86804 RepID=A0A5C3ED76_9BASI|nr:uncharacterized protein UTRI_04402_B [Ustilago trichophora]
MSVTVVTVPVTVTASQSVVVVTSTIAASDLPNYTGQPTATASYPSGSGSGSGSATSQSGSSATNSAGTATGSDTGSGSSSSSASSSGSNSTPIGAIVGGVVGGVALIALLVVLACLMRRRSKARKAANPFPDEQDEKGPAVIAGLPPNPSTTQLRPASGNYSNSIVMTDTASALPLLATDMSMHSSSHATGAPFASDARSSHLHRPSTTSLAPSFMMGSSASFPHSHGSHFGQPPINASLANTQDSLASPFAGGGGGYPDVHRTAYYEPYSMSPSAASVGSAAAAYHHGGAMAALPGSSATMLDPRTHAAGPAVSILPVGAGPADYAGVSEAARMRGMVVGDAAWSGSASLNDGSSRRGSHGSALAVLPAVSHLSEASGHSHKDPDRRAAPAAGFPGYQSNLNTIPGSVAVSEAASGSDHYSMQSGVLSNRGDLSVPPKLPSIPASSPLILQEATSFAPPPPPPPSSQGSLAAAGAAVALSGMASPRLTAEPGTGTFQSNDASNGTYNSDGTYNTYTGAVKGQLRVVGSADAHSQVQATILEDDVLTDQSKRRDMSGDSSSKNGESFWVDASAAPEKSKLGAAGKRLGGQHSANNSTSSINRTGSRMIEMLDTDEQPQVPISVTGGPDELPEASSSSSSRPSFWKERTKSSQSITKAVLRHSPRISANANANGSPAGLSWNSGRIGSSGTESPRPNSNGHRPAAFDLGKSVTESPTSGDTEMWKENSSNFISKSKSSSTGSALRKWTTKKKPSAKSDNEIDIDQLF